MCLISARPFWIRDNGSSDIIGTAMELVAVEKIQPIYHKRPDSFDQASVTFNVKRLAKLQGQKTAGLQLRKTSSAGALSRPCHHHVSPTAQTWSGPPGMPVTPEL